MLFDQEEQSHESMCGIRGYTLAPSQGNLLNPTLVFHPHRTFFFGSALLKMPIILSNVDHLMPANLQNFSSPNPLICSCFIDTSRSPTS